MAVALLALMAMAVSFPARVYANPEGGVVSAGQATITVRPAVVDVHQQSDKAVIDWRSFDIDNGETTQFHQPNAAAIALNRVHSSQASVINGALKANGNVIVVNQNGVLFGRNARVDVNGLVATTADIDNDQFMTQQKLQFNKPGNPNASIVNQGQITARESGLVGFVAPSVENDGVIAARLGRVHLASGDKATVDFYGDGLMEVAVSDDVRHQLVKNTGTISADGGTVALTAAAGNRILASAIEVGGSVSAQTVSTRNGRIVIAGLTTKNHGVAGTVRVSGQLNVASNVAGKKGGSIAVTGDTIRIASGAVLNASGRAGGGDIKIGGDFQGKGATHTASTLVVDRGANILNNALDSGNGGRTILWSNGATDFAGSISNRGGAFGGNGGFVEVSGKQFLGYRGTVDTRAPFGQVGTLLLDPANLTISNAIDSDVTAGTPFDSTGAATSNLNVGTLVAALGSSNVVISTAGGTGGQGDVTFVDPLSWATGFGLTVNADRHIFVNAAITNSGSGYLTLNANTAGSNITVAAPISVGGALTLSAAQDILINNSLNTGGALALTATSRDIIANASGVLTATGALTTSSGRDTTFGANVTSGGNVTVAAARDITVAASRTLTNGATNSLSLQAAGGNTAGTGNLNLNGNLNVGSGALTLVSGINGTRPSWTATTTNLLRQGATFGAVNISGFLNLIVNRDLNSSGGVTLTANNINGAITVGSGVTVSGTNVTTNSALNTTINGAVTTPGAASYTTGQDLVIGAAGSSNSTGNTTVNATRDVLMNGTLTTGGSYTGSVGRDIIMGAGSTLNSAATLGLAARDIVLGNVISGGNITVTASRDLTTLASTTITPGAANNLTLNAAGGSTAGTGNLTLNGTLNAGTGALVLVSGINGTRPSWTATGTNVLRQGATFGAFNVSGFLNLVINRDINSTGAVTLTGNTTGGTITIAATRTVSGTTITTNSALDTTINGTLNSTGTIGITSAQDLIFGAAGSTTSAGTSTFTVTRDITMANGASVNSTGVLGMTGRDITLASVTGGNNVTATATRNLTTLASTTVTNGATNNLSLQAAGGATGGTGNLTLGGNLNVGSGTLTLTSGVNGTRPNWTATTTNLLRQGATFGATTIQGFLNLVIDRDLNSSGAVVLTGNNTGGNITVNATRTVSGTAITTNSNLDTTINGTLNSTGTLVMTSARDLIIGATGVMNATGLTTVTATQDLYLNGTMTASGGLTEAVTRDILMGTGGVLDVTGAITLGGRDIILATVTGTNNITAVATRDLTTRAATTIQPGAAGSLTLYAANNVVTGTGNLTLNGVLRPGSGPLALTSGVNGTRPSYTMTTTNFIPQTTIATTSITGFLDTFINRDLTLNSGNLNITSFRDLTIGATYTLTPGATNNISLAAANNAVGGTGNLYINGILNNGTGTTSLLSGVNGTRPNYTMTSTNFLRQGANFGAINITGFQDTTVDRDLNLNGAININSYRDLNINALRTITSGAAGGIVLTAANNVIAGVGNLNLNGVLQSGTGALTLTSGANGTRPSLTMNGANIQRVGAAFGAVTIQGFLDTFVNDNIISNGTVTITSFRDLTLNAANSITTGTAGALNLRAANNVVTGTGNLYLNGTMSVGNGGLNLLSGVNGTRPNYTITTTNIVPNNTNFGAVVITGFQDFTVDRNMTSTAGIDINAFRDLTIAAGRTVTTSATGALVLRAANNVVTGTGNLYLNGTIGAGTGGLTLLSGVNGTRPDWTATTTNLLQPGANFGPVSIQGLRDMVIDRNIPGTSSVTLLAYRDLTINAGTVVSTSATGAMGIRSAGGAVAGTGRLTINGELDVGTGTLTLLSGINGTRPTWTADSTSLTRLGATFGAINVQGFADFIVDRTLNSTGAITFVNNTRVTLSDDVTSSGAGSAISFTAQPVYIAEGATANVTTNNGAITFGSTLDDTIGGGADNLVTNSGTATTTFTGNVNGIGLNATGNVLTFTPTSIGATRALQNVALTSTTAFSPPSITASTILVRTSGATSNLTLTSGRVLTASAAGNAIVLAAGQNFINNAGVGGLVRTGGGRYIIYSTAPASDTAGGLTYDSRRFSCSFASAGTCAYNATIDSTPTVPGTGNVFLYSMTPIVLVVTPIAIADIIYGDAVPNLTNYAYVPFTLASGYLNADDFNNDVITGTINGQTNYTQGSGIGAYNLSYLNGDLVSSLGYGFDYQTLNNAFNVLPRHVTIDLTGTAGKVYDGNNTATLSGANYTINNIYSGDVLTLGVSNSGATYNNKNVGSNKTVTVNGLALTGAPSGNYILDNTSTVAGVGEITPRALNVTGLSPNKVYNGTTGSSATLSDDRVLGDILTITYGTATFGDKNVGNGKTVTIGGINVTGADAGNYSFNTGTTTTADITPRALTVSAAGINKIYNGNNVGTVTLGDDRVGGDVLTIGYGTALFGDKNVANGKTVNVGGITVTGTDSGNYTFNTSAVTSADITPRTLNVSATGVNRVYNGTNVGTVTLGDDRVGGDVLTTGYGSALFGDKNVANGKTVTVSGITLGGADAGNYTFNSGTTTTANITPFALTVSATGVNRVYDATNVGTVTLGDNRIGGDVLTIGYGSALFGNKNVANGKTVTVSGITVGGADAGNYTFNSGTTTTANITPYALTVGATGINKVYNGNANATVTLNDDRFGGDVLGVTYGGALFPDKNAGNGRTVNVSGINVTGADSANYTFNTTATTTADITPRALTIGSVGTNRVYNGTGIATVTLNDNRVGGDVLTLGYGGALFGDKNVGTGKTINVSGITLGGTDAGNYTYNTTNSTTGNITARALTVSATGTNKVYDGTNVAGITLGDDRVSGDVLSIGYGTSLFGNKNVGNGKTINVNGITVTGADSGNYSFNTTALTSADITPRALTISASGINKIYNGNAVATVTLGDDRVGGDVLTLGYGAASFPDKNVGTGRTVTVTGLTLGGADAGNYTYNTGTSTTADITPRALTVSASGINRVYDGTNVGTVNLGDDRVGGDVLNLAYGSALFGNKNVANGKALNVSGITVTGTDAGNYTFNTTAATTANITPAVLTVGASGINRVYDGSNVAGITLNDDRVGGDVLSITYGTALFPDKNVGNGRTIMVSGINVMGADVGNYTFNTSTTTTANITPYALIVSASGSSKIYDGNANATVTIGDDRVGGDVLSISYGSALFPDKNAGTGRTITVNGISVTGADAGNYTFNTSTTTTADISKATLTVTAANQNIIYGTVVPSTTLGYVGFIGSEGVGDLGTAPSVASGVSGIVNANTYTNNYIVSGGVDGNYSFVYVPGTLTVGKKMLTVTANGQTVTYGTNVPAGTLTYSGFITGEDATDLILAPVVNSGQSGIVNAGTYSNNYTVSGGSSNNYDFSYFNGNLVVTKKDLNVTAGNRSITYGTVVPASSITYSGFIIGDDATDLDVAPSLTSGVSGVVNAGIYTNNYTVSGGTDNNYTYHYAPGTLTVTQAGLNITLNNQSVTYGTVVPGTTITYTGFVNGDNEFDLDVMPTIHSAQSGVVDAGGYAGNYTASGAVSGNYTFNYIAGNLVVNQKALNVTAGNRTIVYGTVVPGSTLTYSGFIGGEGVGDLISAPIITSGQSGVANAGIYAGNYAISGGASNNYYFNFTPGDLTVTARTLTASALPQNIVYGTLVPVGGITYSGFAAGEDATDLAVAPTLSSGVSGMANAGTYINNYTVGGGVSNNYTFVYNNADLVVAKKALSVTANSQTIGYGASVPGSTLTYSGFVTGQNATWLDTAPTVSSVRSGVVDAGIYAANYTASGGVDTNYSFTYTPGTLTVNRAALTISANNVNKVYGSGNTFNGYTISGLELGETVGFVTLSTNASNSAGGQWNAGTWNVAASGATGGTFNPANYTISYLNGTMVITPRALTVTPSAANRVYDGTDLATVSLGDDRVSGDAISLSYGSARFADKNAGAGRIVTVSGIALNGADAGNYTVASTATTTATITKRVLVVTPSAANKLFDGTNLATVTLTDDRLGGDVLVVGYTTARFPDASVGDNRVVTVSGLHLNGADSNNYSVAPNAYTTAHIYSTLPPQPPAVTPPPTVIKVSQDTGSVVVTTTDDGIFATPSGGYQLIYLPFDAPNENRWRNKPLRAGVGGVPIVEPTAWYRWVKLDKNDASANEADI